MLSIFSFKLGKNKTIEIRVFEICELQQIQEVRCQMDLVFIKIPEPGV
jgi:hypothetical protein